MSRTITAYFDSRTDAQTAVDRLVAIGIASSDISIHDSASTSALDTRGTEEKGFWASLGDLFLPDEDRYTYEEGIRRGGSVVTVRAADADFDRASDILEESAVDLDSREAEWRSEGWSGYDASTASSTSASAYGSSSATTGYASDTTLGTQAYGRERASESGYAATGSSDLEGRGDYIPVAEEQIRVGKRDVGNGRVRVRSYVVETPVEESVSLRDERVTLERNPVDRAATAADNLFQERTIEAEEHIEEAVVSKDARVVEEVRLNKDVDVHDETVRDTVRRTEVEIEDERGRTTTSGSTLTDEELNRQRRGY